MTISYVTSAVQDTIISVPTFGNIFNGIIVRELLKLNPNDLEDYMVIVSIKPNDLNGSIIVIHDGGAIWGDDFENMVENGYTVIKSIMPVKSQYDLYFDIDEGILCFLHER